MHLHRLTTQNLPSIRIHDHNSMDTTSDHHSSATSQRSMPREIPIPKHASPTSSRGGSFHGGSIASTAIPPMLSLEPPGPSLPPPTPSSHYDFRPESFGSINGDDSGSDGLRPRKVVSVDVRGGDRDRSDWKLSPIANSLNGDKLSGSHDGFSLRSEDSFDKDWRRGFYKEGDERASPQEHGDSLRLQVQRSVTAYDRRLLGKLNTSSSEPSNYARIRLTPTPPSQSARPHGEAGSLPHPPLPAHWQQPRAGSPRLPSPFASNSPRNSPLERWAHAGEPIPVRSDTEPRPSLLSSSLTDFRNNGDTASLSSSHATDNEQRIRRSASASILGPGYNDYEDDTPMDGVPSSHVSSRMGQLSLHDARSPLHQQHRVGSKRRASSPPNEDRLAGNSEPVKKGPLLESIGAESPSRRTCSPIHHHAGRSQSTIQQKWFQPPPLPRSSSSFASSPSSASTMWSSQIGQYNTPASNFTTPDWGSPATAYQSQRDEPMRDAAFGALVQTRHPLGKGSEKELGGGKYTGERKIYICECCPKKPKKFENKGDLQLHEMEKQYSCAYCNNRFKNKNEAERHQNSLHLRKHSWSCASLAGNYESAFHPSPLRPTCADVCGYCGKEFPNTPAQWNARVDHLTTEHKFGECNQSKKFYRADHFRQHLKHSHSGTSGKWTNVLENACMRDEILPAPINRVPNGEREDVSE